jgi:hypothetical protein
MVTILRRRSIRASGRGSRGWSPRPASRMRSPGSCPLPRTSRRAGTSRSPWPTGTRQRLTRSDSARKSLGGTTLWTRTALIRDPRERSSLPASSRRHRAEQARHHTAALSVSRGAVPRAGSGPPGSASGGAADGAAGPRAGGAESRSLRSATVPRPKVRTGL